MIQVKRRTLVFALAVATVLVAASGAAYALTNRIQMLFYPSLSVLFGSLAYVGAQALGPVNYETVLEALPRPRILDTLVSVGIVALVLLSRTTTLGVGVPFYWVLPLVVLLFVVTIVQRPSNVTLVQLVLLAVALRAAIWFSAPVVGVDSKVHLALTQFVVQSGTIPPNIVTYYHWYPLAHVVAGVVAQLSPASPKQAVFLTQGLYASIGLFAIYFFTTWLLRDVLEPADRARAALFAVLVVAVSPWHLRRSGVLIAQSIGLATIPFVLYTAMRFRERTYAVLAVGFAGLVVFAHNLTPLVLTFLLFSLLAAVRVVRFLRRWARDWWSFDVGYGFPLVFAVGALTVQYWIFIQYLDLQVYRLIYLLTAESNLSEEAAESTLSNTNAFTLADPFLHIGIEQLVFAATLLLLGFVILSRSESGSSSESGSGSVSGSGGGNGSGSEETDSQPMALFLAACVVFAVLSVSLLVGWGANVIRALPNVVLVVAPAFGFLFARSLTTRSLVVLAVVVLLLAFPLSSTLAVTIGTVHPGLSPTDIETSQNYLGASEYAATDFVLQRAPPSTSYLGSYYVAASANYRSAGRQAVTRPPTNPAIQTPLMNVEQRIVQVRYRGEEDRSKALADVRAAPNRFFLNVPRYETSLDPLPGSCSVVYDVGDANIVTC